MMTRRVRLASLLVAVLALSAGHGAPIRTDRPSRAAASIAWYRGDRTRPIVQPAAASPAPGLGQPLPRFACTPSPLPARPFAHALFQRPPPASR